MMIVPESHQDLLADRARADAYLATVMSAGSPPGRPVWFDAQGDCILINAKRLTKGGDMRAHPAVGLLVAEPNDPLRYVQIRGRITEISANGAPEHINGLLMKDRGRPWFPTKGQARVTCRLLPEHVSNA
jgi:hypothetical protein